MGDDRVIQYTSASKSNIGGCNTCGYDPSKQRGVVKTCLDCFLKKHTLRRFKYNVSSVYKATKTSGMCYPGPCDSPDVVVRRATEMLNKNGSSGAANYSKLYEEHPVCFAIWCMTNNQKSAREFVAKSKVKMGMEPLLGLLFVADQVYQTEGPQPDIGEPSGVNAGGEDVDAGGEDVDAGGEDVDEADIAEEDDEGAYDDDEIEFY